jgi:hypothetical protein
MLERKLIIISSQRKTIFECEDGSISDIDAEFDEKELVAITDMLPDEYIPIASAYGGQMSHKTLQGERVEISYHDKHVETIILLQRTIDVEVLVDLGWRYITKSGQ